VHVLDLGPLDGSDPEDNYATVEHELELHDPRLARLPRILALSKADLVDEPTRERARKRWRAKLHGRVPVLVASSVTRLGLDTLAVEIARRVPVQEPQVTPEDAPALAELAEHRVYRPAADRGYTVQRTGEHAFRVSGRGIERLVARYDLDNEDALNHLERRLRGIGVITALEGEGFEPGDEVEIAGVAFDLDPDV
jgi:GTP-binding protein